MNLVDRILAARKSYRDAGNVIRRARHLYMAITWPAIAADTTGATMDHCAQRMLDAGLYWPPTKPLREVRYSILRRAWKLETGAPQWNNPNTWHNWYPRLGFTPFHWRRNAHAKTA
jgi:hypothetical protein